MLCWTRLVYFGGCTSSYVGNVVFCTSVGALDWLGQHQSQPSAPRATTATPNAGRCRQVPRLPRKWNANVTNCRACHAKCRGVTRDERRTSAPPEPAQCHKRHACHANGTMMWPSVTPTTQRAAAPSDYNRDQARHQTQPSAASAAPSARWRMAMPRLPRQTKVDVAKCHACHVKRRWMS